MKEHSKQLIGNVSVRTNMSVADGRQYWMVMFRAKAASPSPRYQRSAASTSSKQEAHPLKFESRKSISYVLKRPLVMFRPRSKRSAKKPAASLGTTTFVPLKDVLSDMLYLQ